MNICLCCVIGLCRGYLYLSICRCKVICFYLSIFLCCFWNFCKIRGFCFWSFCLLLMCICLLLWMRICLLVLVCLWNLICSVCQSWCFCLCLDFFVCLNYFWSSCCLLNCFGNLLVFFLRLFRLVGLLFGTVLIVIFPIFFPGFLVSAIFYVFVSF